MEGLWEVGLGNFILQHIVEIKEDDGSQVYYVLGVPINLSVLTQLFCAVVAFVYLWNKVFPYIVRTLVMMWLWLVGSQS